MDWDQVVRQVTPYVVRIETPSGHGTGFLCLYSDQQVFCGIATAYHVVAHADEWQQPIRIHHHASKSMALFNEGKRFVFADRQRDSAIILVDPGKLQLPETLVPLLPVDTRLPIGAEVGWIGYPAVRRNTQCFFSGRISAFDDFHHAYLIDGVAINGVSGGPVLHSPRDSDSVQIIGSISAYIANRATGETLPGLSVAQDVSHHHEIVSRIKSADEARLAQADEATKQKQPSDGPSADQTDPDPTPPEQEPKQ